jgi:catechol 2,3-dioxygenase-like lactoylglutathione lyase family enzyme
MFKGIDHLVIVVKGLQQAAADYEKLGFTVVPGGKHPVGSHNMLIAFSDGSYLELIGFYRDANDHRWWQPLQSGERLVDYCLQTDDLQGDTQKLRAAGVVINDPVPWSRTRPDGYELKWILSLATGSHRGIAPFLFQDVTPRNERIPQQFDHGNGAIGIDTVTIAVDELTQVERWYSAALGQSGEPVARSELGAGGLRFEIGPHFIEFLMPSNPSSPLVHWTRTYGPSPFSATLRSQISGRRTLDQRLLHGAKIELTGAK